MLVLLLCLYYCLFAAGVGSCLFSLCLLRLFGFGGCVLVVYVLWIFLGLFVFANERFFEFLLFGLCWVFVFVICFLVTSLFAWWFHIWVIWLLNLLFHLLAVCFCLLVCFVSLLMVLLFMGCCLGVVYVCFPGFWRLFPVCLIALLCWVVWVAYVASLLCFYDLCWFCFGAGLALCFWLLVVCCLVFVFELFALLNFIVWSCYLWVTCIWF